MNIHIAIGDDQVTIDFGDHQLTIDLVSDQPTTHVVGAPIENLVNQVHFYDDEIKWRLREERWAYADQHYDHFLAVACRHCGAKVGIECHRPSGQIMKRPQVHSIRHRDSDISPVRVNDEYFARLAEADHIVEEPIPF